MPKTCFNPCASALLAGSFVVGLTAHASSCEFPSGWVEMDSEETSGLRVAVRLGSLPVVINQPFEADVFVCNETDRTVERVAVDATMPAHQHGMNYHPEVDRIDEQSYRASGLLFHMPGSWRISVSTYGPDTTEHFTLDVKAQ